jgi:hypothetical protein
MVVSVIWLVYGGFNHKSMLMVDLAMCLFRSIFSWYKMFWFGKYRIKLALCKLAQNSTSQISCSIVFSLYPPNMCHLPVHHCTDPLYGAAYSNVQVILRMSNWLGSRVYIPTCLPVAHEEDEGSLLFYSVVFALSWTINKLVHETMQFVRF